MAWRRTNRRKIVISTQVTTATTLTKFMGTMVLCDTSSAAITVTLCVEINQCVGCDDAAGLARSSGEEPSLRADKELRRENAVVVLLRYVCASDVYVRALLEDSFWSG